MSKKKTYEVDVYYEYRQRVTVEATSEEEAFQMAEVKAATIDRSEEVYIGQLDMEIHSIDGIEKDY